MSDNKVILVLISLICFFLILFFNSSEKQVVGSESKDLKVIKVENDFVLKEKYGLKYSSKEILNEIYDNGTSRHYYYFVLPTTFYSSIWQYLDGNDFTFQDVKGFEGTRLWGVSKKRVFNETIDQVCESELVTVCRNESFVEDVDGEPVETFKEVCDTHEEGRTCRDVQREMIEFELVRVESPSASSPYSEWLLDVGLESFSSGHFALSVSVGGNSYGLD